MLTEIDKSVMEWLEGHHIRAKDVRAYVAEGKVGDLTVISLEVYVPGVDEIKPPVSQWCPAGTHRIFGLNSRGGCYKCEDRKDPGQ